MAWDNGNVSALLMAQNQKVGRIGPQPLMGLVRSARDNQGQADQPNPREVTITNANGTAQVAVTGAGRLFKIRVDNLTADIVFVVCSDSVDLQIIAAAKAAARISATVAQGAESTNFEDPNVTGTLFSTSLRVRAFKLDGTGNVGAANGVTVTLLVG